jgi:hypothetical protein
MQEAAAKALTIIARDAPDTRALIGAMPGCIPALVAMLRSGDAPDTHLQSAAVCLIRYLVDGQESVCEAVVLQNDCLQSLVALLRSDSVREDAAAAVLALASQPPNGPAAVVCMPDSLAALADMMTQHDNPPKTQAAALQALSALAQTPGCGPRLLEEAPECIPALVALVRGGGTPQDMQLAAAKALSGLCEGGAVDAVSAVRGSVKSLAALAIGPDIPAATKEAASDALGCLVSGPKRQGNKDALLAVDGSLAALVAQLGPDSPPELQASAAALLSHLANGSNRAKKRIAAADGCITALVAAINSEQGMEVVAWAACALGFLVQVGRSNEW